MWSEIHLSPQRRYNQMPMRLGATNPRSAPIYRRELHRLPLCELPSRDTEQQTLAKFLISYKRELFILTQIYFNANFHKLIVNYYIIKN